jgi:hypothetical protein
MNFKIIETSEKYPNLLLYRDRDENCNELVFLITIGKIDGESDMFASEYIEFGNSKTAKCFINDFSKKSADKWCELNTVLL